MGTTTSPDYEMLYENLFRRYAALEAQNAELVDQLATVRELKEIYLAENAALRKRLEQFEKASIDELFRDEDDYMR